MQTFDASALFDLWEFYPLGQFPKLWVWIGEQVAKGEFTAPVPAFEPVERKIPEFGSWLKKRGVRRLPKDEAVLVEALRIKKLLGIQEEKYGSKGVDQNDLLIIATARVHGVELITTEGRQNQKPTEMKQYRIPTVCDLPDVGVIHHNLIEVIRASKKVF